ncbi:hypothetical protein Tco_1500230 [Tanacetum coccineum]
MASLDIPSEANNEDADIIIDYRNVYRFIESFDELELARIATTDAMTTFKNVVARIVQEFTGRIPGDGTTIQDTLGARITTLKAWMKKECLQETAKKEAQVKLCCEMQSDNVGHYANTCPKKGERKETEVLKMAYNLGYEPLEDSDIDSEIEIYAYTNSSDYSSDTSSSYE